MIGVMGGGRVVTWPEMKKCTRRLSPFLRNLLEPIPIPGDCLEAGIVHESLGGPSASEDLQPHDFTLLSQLKLP